MTRSPADDHRDFEILDEYLRRLHAREEVDRDALVRAHPHLESLLGCLEAIEGVALGGEDGQVGGADVAQSSLSAAAARCPQTVADEATPVISGGAGSWSAPPLPCEFGGYLLIDEIGRGGMGVVYRARQAGLDRLVALKMIQPLHLASPEHVRRFEAEARAAAKLQHPSIVHIHDVGRLHGQHFFSMEYIEGESLAEPIARGPVAPETAARLMIQIARAVAYLHRQGVVHRDLKPSNILLDADGEPFLTDFGLAKTRAGVDQTMTGTVLGTPSYMAPEQAMGRGDSVGPASDIYSLGAILYELLTGQPPFREETPLDTLLKVMTGEPALPRRVNRSIPRPLQWICMKCLSKSPESRYESADALADDLERYLRGESPLIRPPRLMQRVARWGRREAALATRLGVLAAFFAIDITTYSLGHLDKAYHDQMIRIMAVWVLISIAGQYLLKLKIFSVYAHSVWGLIDAFLLLTVLRLANGVASPLVVLLPLLILAAGLWLRERLVWMMTALTLLIYGYLVCDFYFWRTDLQQQFDTRFDRHVIFAVMLITVGVVVAYLVHRVRVLSRYCGRKA